MKYLHIMPDSIYSKDYMERVNKLYDSSEHYFIIMRCNGERKYPLKNAMILNHVNNRDLRVIIKSMFSAEQVILHSLYIEKNLLLSIAILSCLMPHKYSWYIWSADLYKSHKLELQIRGIALSKRVKRWCRSCIIGHLHKIIVITEEDYIYAKWAYKTKAIMVQAEYAFNLIDVKTVEKTNGCITVLAGHSSSTSLLHKEMYDRLSFLATESVEIFSILSYQNAKEYTEKVIEYGKTIFGNKYKPVTEWMSYDEYVRLLSQIDVALFEGECQNGAANIFILLYLGKKIYLSEKNSIFHQLKREGIVCFSKEELQQSFFEPLTNTERENNKKIVKRLLSDEVFKEKWDRVFT